MPPKRSLPLHPPTALDPPARKRRRTFRPADSLSALSDELLLRVLGFLPLKALSRCRAVSARIGRLAGDGQVWKRLFVARFGPAGVARKGDLGWRERYRLRDNWARGVCVVRGLEEGGKEEEGVRTGEHARLVRLVGGWVVDVDAGRLRSRALRGGGQGASVLLSGTSSCLAVDEDQMLLAVGFADGAWGIWRLDEGGGLRSIYRSSRSMNGALAQIAVGEGCAITMSENMVLSIYTISNTNFDTEAGIADEGHGDVSSTHLDNDSGKPMQPRLLTSLHSHTTWPPLTLSIRRSKSTLIASIAYSLPTYLSGWTIGIQELHLSPDSPQPIITSRLATSTAQAFHSLPTATATTDGREVATAEKQPQALSYHHPYLLASYGDNTMTLYMVRSTETGLWIGKGERLWGCTSGVRGMGLGGRGKAVSVCEGGEVRIWELERGLGRWGKGRGGEVDCVRVRTKGDVDADDGPDAASASASASGVAGVGFNQEVVVVRGGEGLRVYDFA